MLLYLAFVREEQLSGRKAFAHKFGIRAVILCFFILPSDKELHANAKKISASVLNNDFRV